MKCTCSYCDSAFLKFINSEEQLREHIMKAHVRELSFTRKTIGQMPGGAKKKGPDRQITTSNH